MKVIITKNICDACGKEILGERHYMMNIGFSDNWEDEAEISQQLTTKDLCQDCYDTIMALIGEKPVQKERATADKTSKSRGNYDKDLVRDLWAQGLTYKQIVAKTGYKMHNVVYAMRSMTEKERQEWKDKYVKEIKEEEPGLTYTTDANGMVISIK